MQYSKYPCCLCSLTKFLQKNLRQVYIGECNLHEVFAVTRLVSLYSDVSVQPSLASQDTTLVHNQDMKVATIFDCLYAEDKLAAAMLIGS